MTKNNKREEPEIRGAILIWGRTTPAGVTAVKDAFKFEEVLSLESIAAELVKARSDEYTKLVETRTRWCNELFDGLLPPGDERQP